MTFDLIFALGLVVTGVLSALVGLLVLAVLQQKDRQHKKSIFMEDTGNAEYLFDGNRLIDATPAARSLLPKVCQHETAIWPRLMTYLEQEFPGSTTQLQNLSTEGVLMMGNPAESKSAPLLLRAELRGGLTRIMISDTETASSKHTMDPLTRRAIRDELEQLRLISANAPLPIWRESVAGEVIWANAYYLELAARQLDEDEQLTWPLPKLFEDIAEPDTNTKAIPNTATTHRQQLVLRGQSDKRWFDLFYTYDANGRQAYALPADGVVKAEENLREFMQTLTKTFAHLPTGLAIFDQNRRLVLFNPALMELTGISPDLLIKRPLLPTFFDLLRDNSMIPEPRNYKSWRKQIISIEEAAATGVYEDVWNLPGGQTYRVVGRPHPNGALALSFEDISTEMSRTRRYRADLELGQSVIDAIDAAIAVFSASGILVMTNAAYVELWGHDPSATLGGEGSITALCDRWRQATAPTTMWDRVEDFSASTDLRLKWDDTARFKDGRLITCQFAPLAAGATMVTFRRAIAKDDSKASQSTTGLKSA